MNTIYDIPRNSNPLIGCLCNYYLTPTFRSRLCSVMKFQKVHPERSESSCVDDDVEEEEEEVFRDEFFYRRHSEAASFSERSGRTNSFRTRSMGSTQRSQKRFL